MRDYAKGPVRNPPYDGRRLWSDRFGYVHLQGNNFYRCLFDGTGPKYGKSVARDLAVIVNEACAEAIRDTKRRERKRAARIVLSYPCQLILDKHTDEVRVYLANRILGTRRKA